MASHQSGGTRPSASESGETSGAPSCTSWRPPTRAFGCSPEQTVVGFPSPTCRLVTNCLRSLAQVKQVFESVPVHVSRCAASTRQKPMISGISRHRALHGRALDNPRCAGGARERRAPWRICSRNVVAEVGHRWLAGKVATESLQGRAIWAGDGRPRIDWPMDEMLCTRRCCEP